MCIFIMIKTDCWGKLKLGYQAPYSKHNTLDELTAKLFTPYIIERGFTLVSS